MAQAIPEEAEDGKQGTRAQSDERPAPVVSLMIVDDSRFMRAMIRQILARSPLASSIQLVAEAASGMEGVQKFRESRPRLVLMDIVMPLGSGIEALREMRRTDPAIEIVVVSALDRKGTRDEAQREGVREFLAKPVRAQDLVAAVGRSLTRLSRKTSPGREEGLPANQAVRGDVHEEFLDDAAREILGGAFGRVVGRTRDSVARMLRTESVVTLMNWRVGQADSLVRSFVTGKEPLWSMVTPIAGHGDGALVVSLSDEATRTIAELATDRPGPEAKLPAAREFLNVVSTQLLVAVGEEFGLAFGVPTQVLVFEPVASVVDFAVSYVVPRPEYSIVLGIRIVAGNHVFQLPCILVVGKAGMDGMLSAR